MKSLNLIVVFFLLLNVLTVSIFVNNAIAIPNTYYGGPNDQSQQRSLQSTFPVQSQDIQNANPNFSVGMIARILHDNAEGHSAGWTPDGSSKTFLISDNSIDPQKSIVIINTVQDNFVTCSVDYLAKGIFEVHCDTPPAKNAELHYLVINNNIVPEITSTSNITSRIQKHAQAEFGSLPRELQMTHNKTNTGLNNMPNNLSNNTTTTSNPNTSVKSNNTTTTSNPNTSVKSNNTTTTSNPNTSVKSNILKP